MPLHNELQDACFAAGELREGGITGELRGNLAAGARGVAQPVTKRHREIGEALGPVLAKRGLLLVGLDVIGDKLTEVNVTSPTCFREIQDQTGFDVSGMFLEALEKKIQ